MSAIALRAKAEQERRRRRRSITMDAALLEQTPQDWLVHLFPAYMRGGFSQRHDDFWSWTWSVTPGIRPRPIVIIWPRGGGKSTSAEMVCISFGARKIRKYAWYISRTQEQADKHVESIAAALDSKQMETYYGTMAQRGVSKYGHSKGWRRSRLVTASGFCVDALGLDVAARGGRFEEQRPDLMIFDDIDKLHDSPDVTKRLIEIISMSLLPAGTDDTAIIFAQNLISNTGVFARLLDNTAGFLTDRMISGPHPALAGEVKYHVTVRADGSRTHHITSGTPTWDGQGLAACEAHMNTLGPSSFFSECQHNVEPPPGGIYDEMEWLHCLPEDVPKLFSIQAWIDPAMTESDDSDSAAIQIDGIAEATGILYRLYSWEERATPQKAMRHCILKAIEYGADSIGVETDQGGDTWESVYREAWRSLVEEGLIDKDRPKLRYLSAKAGAGHGGKVERQLRQFSAYETGKIIHVEGTHRPLEAGLRRFPKTKPFDLADASYWSWWHLRELWKAGRKKHQGSVKGKRQRISLGRIQQ